MFFDVVDMLYTYNALFGRRLINTFLAVLHHWYLCMKMPGPNGVISVYGNQVEARRIECGMSPGQKPVHVVVSKEQPERAEVCLLVVPKVKPMEGTKEVVLFPERPEQTKLIGRELSPERKAELLTFLWQNLDVFASSPKDLLGIDRSVAEHRLDVDPSIRLV